MNIAEALSREVQRVSILRERYGAMAGMSGVNVAPVVTLIDDALEQAHKAAGSGEALDVSIALAQLKGFTE